MTLPVKVAAGFVGLTIIGVGSLGGYELIKPKSIRDRLSKNGDSILDVKTKYESEETQKDSEDYENWKAIISGYQETDTNIKTFANWGDNSLKEYQKINKLKDACEKSLDIMEGNENFDNELQNVKKFCVKRSQD